MTAQRQITLPENLCAAAEQKFHASFDTIESLLEFVLRELTRTDVEALDRAEQALVEERLRNLGYI